MVIRLEDESSWPVPVLEFYERNRDFYHDWETRRMRLERDWSNVGTMGSRARAAQYDLLHAEFEALVEPHWLRGYHCTKLADFEIEDVRSRGMRLPDLTVLQRRVDAVCSRGLLSREIGRRLVAENQASDDNRAGMLWFCFFEPRLAGQHGIERFFRSWGGEALYNSHEDDGVTGPALNGIGLPCVIEAEVPISSLRNIGNLPDVMSRRFLVNRGFKTGESLDFEGATTLDVPSARIRRISIFPEPSFLSLTGCAGWDPPL